MSGNTLSPHLIRESLLGFLDSAITVESIKNGFVFTSNACMPDGWQIPFEITQVTPNRFKLSDRGLILTTLANNGQNIEANTTKRYIDQFCADCEVQRSKWELFKWIEAPLKGEEIHVFSEALQGIANLYLLKESRIEEEKVGVNIVKKIYQDAEIPFTQNHTFKIAEERKFKVEFYAEETNHSAIKILTSKTDFNGSVEQWATRWRVIKEHHPQVAPIMLYDRNVHQALSLYTKTIAQEPCNLFCGIDEKDRIHDAITKKAA